jgi:Ca2+-binding RTX toxin-like protein
MDDYIIGADGSAITVNSAVYPVTNDGDDTLTNIENLQFTEGGSLSIANVSGNITITGTSGNDSIRVWDGIDVVHGGDGDDVIENNAELGGYIYGDAGNDTLSSNGWNQTLDGGAGFDTADFSMSSNLVINLANGTVIGFGTNNITNIESVIGGDFSDTIIGGSADETLRGGWGYDMLTGGGGNDTFVFSAGDIAPVGDEITDFTSGVDKIKFVGMSHHFLWRQSSRPLLH